MEETKDLSKQIDFKSLTYWCQGKYDQKTYRSFKGSLGSYKNTKEGDITLEKVDEDQKQFRSKINEVVITSKKSQDQKCTIKDIKILYESRKKVIKSFDDYWMNKKQFLVYEKTFRSYKSSSATKWMRFTQLFCFLSKIINC